MTSDLLGVNSEDVCGEEFSYDFTVINYKYICDGLLVSIIGCLGVLGEQYFDTNKWDDSIFFFLLKATYFQSMFSQNQN